MSEFNVVVVEIDRVETHPNADALDIVKVWDYPCIVKRGSFKPGDRAVYVPIDALVPLDDPAFAFLAPHRRLRAKRLRGVFSQGLLIPARDGMEVGQDVREQLGITKWEPEVEMESTHRDPEVRCPFEFPRYTDVEGLRRHPGILDGRHVVATEKIHGANGRAVYRDGQLWVGSHRRVIAPCETNLWWKAAKKHQLEEKLAAHPDVVVFFEVYGQVQDLKYDQQDLAIGVFDTYDLKQARYNDWQQTERLCVDENLPLVPVLAGGLYDESMRALAEGKSTLASHVREGVVFHLWNEAYDHRIGRVITKLVGEGFLTRKEAK